MARARAMTLAMGPLLMMVPAILGAAPPPVAATESLGASQGGPAVVRTEIDTTAITVGGRLQLTVTVDHDVGTVVSWPDSLDLSPFELLDAVVMEPQRVDGRLRSMARFTITAFELGELEIPSFAVELLGSDNTATEDMSTQSLPVTVASVGRDESGDIRDIKGPLAIARDWLMLWPWALALVALGAAVWLFRRYRRSRQPVAVQPPKMPPRPAHELAYEALDRLERSGLLDRGEIKAHFIAVSEIIRAYIEGRYGIQALELATHEVMAGLEDVELVPDMSRVFERFFAECDLVKFAKLIPDPVACREIVPAARRLVDGTRPIESEAEELATAVAAEAGPSSSEAAER